MSDDDKARRFRELALPHLDAAYNLARWLVRDADQAQDVVQEAFLRAFRYFDGYRGGDARAWVLRIVRHSAYDWLQTTAARREVQPADPFAADSEQEGSGAAEPRAAEADPETRASARRDAAAMNALIEALPPEFREVLVLREIEDLSYREIAETLAVPPGTVMSRLSRARALLRKGWEQRVRGTVPDGL